MNLTVEGIMIAVIGILFTFTTWMAKEYKNRNDKEHEMFFKKNEKLSEALIRIETILDAFAPTILNGDYAKLKAKIKGK